MLRWVRSEEVIAYSSQAVLEDLFKKYVDLTWRNCLLCHIIGADPLMADIKFGQMVV
jgi:hypothetical protein